MSLSSATNRVVLVLGRTNDDLQTLVCIKRRLISSQNPVMRLWLFCLLPAALPFIIFGCSDIGWGEDLDHQGVCVCGIAKPEEFAECIELGYPPDPETCPADAGIDGATDV